VYHVSVPSPTPTSSASVAPDERLPEIAAGAAAVQSAIVRGLKAVAANAVANARRGVPTSSEVSSPNRARNPIQIVRAPIAARIAPPRIAKAVRASPVSSSARPRPAIPSAA
jgi:hypothetical protein